MATFIYRKHRMLVGVIENRDDDLVKKRRAALDDIKVPVGQRIK